MVRPQPASLLLFSAGSVFFERCFSAIGFKCVCGYRKIPSSARGREISADLEAEVFDAFYNQDETKTFRISKVARLDPADGGSRNLAKYCRISEISQYPRGGNSVL